MVSVLTSLDLSSKSNPKTSATPLINRWKALQPRPMWPSTLGAMISAVSTVVGESRGVATENALSLHGQDVRQIHLLVTALSCSCAGSSTGPSRRLIARTVGGVTDCFGLFLTLRR